MNAAALRELADLVDQGHPFDYLGVGDEITIVATIASAARWVERCPNDRLPLTGVPVDVRIVEVPVDLNEVPC
jgi:hypothetical protein